MNSFGLFEAHYATDQLANESQSTIAWLGAIAIFFVFSVSVISGAIQDVLGPRVGYLATNLCLWLKLTLLVVAYDDRVCRNGFRFNDDFIV